MHLSECGDNTVSSLLLSTTWNLIDLHISHGFKITQCGKGVALALNDCTHTLHRPRVNECQLLSVLNDK